MHAEKYIAIRFGVQYIESVWEYLNSLAGANRFIWNQALGILKDQHEKSGKAAYRINTLGKQLTRLRSEHQWLADEHRTRTTMLALKRLSDAWAAYVAGIREMPNFKAKYKSKKSFGVHLNAGQLKDNGRLVLKDGVSIRLNGYRSRLGEYVNSRPKSASIFFEKGRWYCVVFYEVDAMDVTVTGDGIGIDRNTGKAAYVTSEGSIFSLPDVTRIEGRIRFLQKRLARQKKGSNRWRKTVKTLSRHRRKIKNIRSNAQRHIIKVITANHDLVFLEDLKTKSLTKSAKGTVENPGKGVRAKSALTKCILDVGWGQFARYLGERALVILVCPAYTSQTCYACKHAAKENRNGRHFRCVACGHTAHADINAAMNIRQLGKAALKDAEVLTVRLPMRRQEMCFHLST